MRRFGLIANQASGQAKMQSNTTLRERVLEAGRSVLAADRDSLARTLSEFVSTFVGRPYAAAPAVLQGTDGTQSAMFACVAFTTDASASSELSDGYIPCARAAAVIDACDKLTLEGLREAYGRIAGAKRLRKEESSSKTTGRRSELLGVMLARRSPLSLEAIAKEMERLNTEMSATLWPDMVAIAETGLVQYSAHFPGENITGDFYLPGARMSYTPPMYIIMVMKPSGTHTLNRMLSFVVGHLALFAPGADVPRFPDIVQGMTNTAVTQTGYQYNLAGDLVRVPREFYNDRYLPPLPYIIYDGRGRVLGAVQFLRWQDGGVIFLRGDLPLEMLLAFLGPVAARKGVVRREGRQMSYAMPITEADFQAMLARFQRQSNMVVQPDETEWVVKKFADEGSSSPFMARVLLGMFKLRDAALTDAVERDRFDKAYQAVTMPLLDARTRVQKIACVWDDHARRVRAGEIARVQGRAIHVDESIDHELGQEVDAFLNATTRALKTGMQAVASELGVTIGFLFQKQAAFETGLAALSAQDPSLAAYLQQVRAEWSETLVNRRNAIEHEGWRLPDVTYARAGNCVSAHAPIVEGQEVSSYVAFTFDRLSRFVEEVTAHLLQRRLRDGVTITEVPRDQRPTEAPERFRVTLAIGGLPPWTIAYDAKSFEEM